MFDRVVIKEFDLPLFLVTLLIFCMGLVFLHSASYQKAAEIGKNFTLSQVQWMAISLCAFILTISISYNKFINIAYALYGIIILLLISVLVVGGLIFGAKRWVNVAGMTFQPSEFAKLVVILAVARYLGRSEQTTRGFRDLLIPLALMSVPAVLILLQPDLGTAMILFPVVFAMLYVSGMGKKYLLRCLGVVVLCMPVFWFFLKDYQRNRLLVFINPDRDPLGAGYTIIQSKIALGSGGIAGKGWLSGTQNLLNFLPERHTDFIFSIVGEEWGFLGASLVILAYLFLITRCISAVNVTTDPGAKLLVTGIATMLALQIFINIGMTMGLVPVVGLPLPLISYGGSSLLTTMIAIGLVINVRMRRSIF
jgi:rod shape determining protein RodA